MAAVEESKRAILGLYRDDIGKFAGRLKTKVRAIWEEIPGALSRHERRFYPGSVGQRGICIGQGDAGAKRGPARKPAVVVEW